jgi:hypothetical protein
MNERKPWDRMEGEPDLWYARFAVYLRMGSKRSVHALFKRTTKKNQEEPRGNAGPDWYDTEKEWKWEERARAYDEHLRAEEDKLRAEEKEKVLRSGFALQHRRIEVYDRLLRKLIGYTRDDDKVWLSDLKSVQIGLDSYERVDLVHFNAPLFTLIDRYLSAIAAEMGERVKKKEVQLIELPPNVYMNFDPDQDGSES